MVPRRSFAVIRRVLRARDVFGKAVQSDGVTLIPVASVVGGGGAGGGERSGAVSADADALPQAGEGLGFGLLARPVGAFEIRDGKARWRPAVDVTRLTLGAMLAGLVLARWLLRER